jgi:signal transduction histidine kinase
MRATPIDAASSPRPTRPPGLDPRPAAASLPMQEPSLLSGTARRSTIIAGFTSLALIAVAMLLLVQAAPTGSVLLSAIALIIAVAAAAIRAAVAAAGFDEPADTAARAPASDAGTGPSTSLAETGAQMTRLEKMASLGQLTAGIAHEINNPVNFVRASISPLRRDIEALLDGELDEADRSETIEEIRSLLRGIDDGAARTAEIVRGLRSFSRSDDSEIRRIDLHEGIDSTLVLLHNTYRERIEVVRDYADLPPIECYPGQLNQVFMNLLSNAVQSIDGAGRITIRTERVGDCVRVEISDTGSGIPDAVRARIFDPFFTTKEAGTGTGLGLSITLEIVRRHGGTIDVESLPGAGTTFTLTLPISHATRSDQ